MTIFVEDSQIVGETSSTLVSAFQQGATSMQVIMKNSGVNTINYQWQEQTGSGWQVIGNAGPGTIYYNTIMPNQVISLAVISAFSQVQLTGNASGGALIELAITRYANRESGGPIPILNL